MTTDNNKSRRARRRQSESGVPYREALAVERNLDDIRRGIREHLEIAANLDSRLADENEPELIAELQSELGFAAMLGSAASIYGAEPSDEVASARARSYEMCVRLITEWPESAEAQAVDGRSRTVEDTNDGIVVSVRVNEEIARAWEAQADRDERFRYFADRARDTRTEPVVEVLNRWLADEPDGQWGKWLDKAKAQALADPHVDD